MAQRIEGLWLCPRTEWWKYWDKSTVGHLGSKCGAYAIRNGPQKRPKEPMRHGIPFKRIAVDVADLFQRVKLETKVKQKRGNRLPLRWTLTT